MKANIIEHKVIDGELYVSARDYGKNLDYITESLRKSLHTAQMMQNTIYDGDERIGRLEREINELISQKNNLTNYVFKLISKIENSNNIVLTTDSNGYNYDVVSDEEYKKWQEWCEENESDEDDSEE